MKEGISRSHPDFKQIFEIADEIAKRTSPQRWADLQHIKKDSPENKAEIEKLKGEQQELLDSKIDFT